MVNCAVQACAKIQILNIPANGTRFGLTTPDAITHIFEYDYFGTSSADFTIQIRPAPIGGDSIQDVIAKTVAAIVATTLFSNCSYDPVNHCIWVCQMFAGLAGNTTNNVTTNDIIISNFSGGEDNKTSTFGDGSAADTTAQQKAVDNFSKNFNNTRSKDARKLAENKKQINVKKKKADNCKTPNSSKAFRKMPAGSSGRPDQRKIPCPTCTPSNKVKDKIAGRNYFQIPFTEFKVPRLDHLVDSIPTFDENRRDGGKCGACGGSKQITDVTDDTSKYQQAAEKIKENAEKIMEKESKLGLGGTRTTIVQGSDLLFVGLGFNSNKTYEVMPGGSIAPTMNGGKIPQQNSVPVNAVVGKQGSLAWPQQVGNYTIKCANKFSLLAGAGGITIATPGPLTFSSGMMKITGPQITIGCSSGPLILEGDSVNISGKAISLTPSGGELFIKGNISNTGNITTQGHAHFESMSFAKASCVGINKSTLQATANPDVVSTQRATWGGAALAAALLDLQTFYQAVPMDSDSSSYRLMSPKENQNIADRLKSIAKLSIPWEGEITGYILPGTEIDLSGDFVITGDFPCNYGGTAHGTMHGNGTFKGTNTNFVNIHNIPHIHGIPEMKHTHEVYLPDMDYTNNSTQSLRDKVLTGSHESGIPSDPTKDTVSRLGEVQRTAVEYRSAGIVNSTRNAATGIRLA